MQQKTNYFAPLEWCGFWITAAIAFSVYLFTLAPNVGLEDSGEFLTASYNFGVPHPPGYPSWTILAYLFEQIPYGNAAWRVNLMSAFFGALSAGMLSLITSKITGGILKMEMFQKFQLEGISNEKMCLMASVASGLIFAFIDTMWSQAVIAEVYTLNSFFFTSLCILVLRWFDAPGHVRWPVYIALVFGVGITNHQTLLVSAPAFLFAIYCADRSFFRQIAFLASLGCGVLAWQMKLYYFMGGFSVLFLFLFIYLTIRARDAFTLGSLICTLFSALCGLMAVAIFSDGKPFSEWRLSGFWVEQRGIWMTFAIILSVIWLILFCLWIFQVWYSVPEGKRQKTIITISGSVLPLMLAASIFWFKPRWLVWAALLLVVWFALFCFWIFQLWNASSQKDQYRTTIAFWGSFLALVLGVSINGYMYVSSITNPPMNWGHVQSWQEFHHHITRGQYEKINLARPPDVLAEQFMGFFKDLDENFSFPLILMGLVPFLFILDFPKKERNYYVFTVLCFVFMGLILVILQNPKLDLQSGFINRVFYALAHGVYSIWIGVGSLFVLKMVKNGGSRGPVFFLAMLFVSGIALGLNFLGRLFPNGYDLTSFISFFNWMTGGCVYLLFLFLLLHKHKERILIQSMVFGLPLLPLVMNWKGSEMRGHDFGWRYGHEMLKDLDRDAVVYGGTDPGRFVPTYMIFVESFQPPRWREDPTFDRRDLYIITQNALADQTYMNYIRDHYDVRRPKMDQWYHKLFGRDQTYPKEPLILPTTDEFEELFQSVIQANANSEWIRYDRNKDGSVRQASVQGVEGVFAINGAIAQWIFERNKDKHTFYVEESYPLQWMYPYLEPCGLIMKINKEPIPGLTPRQVQKDMDYWNSLTANLLSNPAFCRDDVARKSYSKLRSSLAGLYVYRNMFKEAETAFLESLDLYPASGEARSRLMEMYLALDRYSDAVHVCEVWKKLDPRSPAPVQSLDRVRYMQNQTQKISEMAPLFGMNKGDPSFVFEYLQALKQRNKWNTIDQVVNEFLEQKDSDLMWWQTIVQFYADSNKPDQVEKVMVKLTKREPNNPRIWLNLAYVQAVQMQSTQACESLKQTIRLDPSFLEAAQADTRFNGIRNTEIFQKMIQQQLEHRGK